MNSHIKMFNKIAFIYQWFFPLQVKHYLKTIRKYENYLDISRGDNVLDIGCGTGAFSYSLKNSGYNVTGVDASSAMVKQARKNNVDCIKGDVIKGLDFPDNSFELVTAVYVAHGLARVNRIKLYREAKRLTRGQAIFYDYNQKDRFIFSLVNIVEYLEGKNYFSFKNHAVEEMKNVFASVEIIDTGVWNCWYICSEQGRNCLQ